MDAQALLTRRRWLRGLVAAAVAWTPLAEAGPHRIQTTHPTLGTRGIYLEGEIAGLATPLWIDALTFPALRGSNDAQRMTNLETDLHVVLDAAVGATAQRIRVKIFRLVPLEYTSGVFSSASDITPNWWAP